MGTPEAVDVAAAYRECETITRQQAKNFAYGIALLPGDKRRALSAVYAYARRIDDIGDGTLPVPEKVAELAAARAALTKLAEGSAADAAATGDLVLIALRDAADRFPVPLAAFGELIDGCEADVRGVSYASFADLEHYCRCVAGSIGRLSLGVFGVFGCADQAVASPLADSLGVALQLTNILRDIREDLGNGRVYLPAEDLAKFGCDLTPPEPDGAGGEGKIDGPMGDLIRFEADRARSWYATGLRLIPMLDRRSAACTGAMAGIYRRLLEHIAARPETALAERMSLPGREKAVIAITALSGIGRHRAGRQAAAGGQP
ncbi:MAG TPA: squalene/phytoene synthase family protein [Streptosporangiaceae bacterium]|nr:squalene/phytoene synthase family protein [Streptosporangiaceae bacterium]